MAACRTRCCSSCSPTRASGRRSVQRPDPFLPTYSRNPVTFVRGEGARLWDADGNEYLDFLWGSSLPSLGHCPPAVVAAVREQAERLMHVGNLYFNEPGERLAARLVESPLGGGRVFLQ